VNKRRKQGRQEGKKGGMGERRNGGRKEVYGLLHSLHDLFSALPLPLAGRDDRASHTPSFRSVSLLSLCRHGKDPTPQKGGQRMIERKCSKDRKEEEEMK